MYQLNILITTFSFSVVLYYCFVNLKGQKKFQNIFFSIYCFISCIFFAALFLQALHYELIPYEKQGHLLIGIIILLISLLFYQFFIFPEQLLKKNRLLSLIPALPAIAFAPVVIFTDFVKIEVHDALVFFIPGTELAMFLILAGIYLLSALIILYFRSRADAYFFMRREIFHITTGLTIGILLFILMTFMPQFIPPLLEYRIIGVSLSALFIVTIMHRALNNTAEIDIKRLYVETGYNILLLLLMAAPVYGAFYLFEITAVFPFVVAGLIIIYLFLFYKFFKPLIENSIWKGYRNLAERFTETLFSLQDITTQASEDKPDFWDQFYSSAMDNFILKFNMFLGSLYLYDGDEEVFFLRHSYGEGSPPHALTKENPLIKIISVKNTVVDRKKLFFDEDYNPFKDPALELMDEYGFEVLLPLFNSDDQILGFAALSGFRDKANFSRTFLSALDIYRIQFQYQLSNGLFLEKIKKEKITEHDKNAVSLIKKKVIPSRMDKIKNLRVASFYINNSEYGGDYFDSSAIDENRLIIMAADTGYSGVDSGMLYLQLYSILHSFSKSISSPDMLLKRAVRILFTLEKKEAAVPVSVLLISGRTREVHYSSAGFNPLIIYDKEKNSFEEHKQRTAPIVIDESAEFREFFSEKIPFSDKNTGILFSEGFANARNSSGDIYDISSMEKVIQNNPDDSPAVLVRKIYKDLIDFTEGIRQTRDISLLIFREQKR